MGVEISRLELSDVIVWATEDDHDLVKNSESDVAANLTHSGEA